jgi:glycosyltransferase involved in cell wall biosynthesis
VFPDSLIQTGIASEKSILFRMGHTMEQFTYRNIDHIVVPSEAIKENLLLKNVPNEKITVIRNWVNENDVKPIERENNRLIEEFELDKNLFYVVYAGNMGPAQDIESILNVAKKIRSISEIRFILFGRGTQFEEYIEKVKNSDLDNVVFLPLQSYERVSEVYSLGDACIVSCKAGIGKAALPSKTWSIMATERAVLANFDSESDMGSILKETEAGLLNEPGNIEEFAENILYLYKNIDECRKMGKKGRGFVLKYLNQEYGVKQYVSCMKSVMGERNG